MTETGSKNWISVLQDISNAINNTKNRSIKMPPNQVDFDNRDEVFNNLYGSISPPVLCKFRIGDLVRIPLQQNIFSKSFKVRWTKELYKIVEIHNENTVCFYKLETQEGKLLERFFYTQELNLVLKHEIREA